MRVWKAQHHLQHVKNDQRVMMIFLLILLSNVFDHKVRPAPYLVPPAMAHHHPSPLPCLLQYPAMTRMIPARLRIPYMFLYVVWNASKGSIGLFSLRLPGSLEHSTLMTLHSSYCNAFLMSPSMNHATYFNPWQNGTPVNQANWARIIIWLLWNVAQIKFGHILKKRHHPLQLLDQSITKHWLHCHPSKHQSLNYDPQE